MRATESVQSETARNFSRLFNESTPIASCDDQSADHEQKHAPSEGDPCKALVTNRPMTEGVHLFEGGSAPITNTTGPSLGRATDSAGRIPPAPITNTTGPGLGRATDSAGRIPPAPITNTTGPGLGRATDSAGRIPPAPITNTTGPSLGRATDSAGRIPPAPGTNTTGPGLGRATDAAGPIPGRLRMCHDRGTAYDSHRQGQDQSIAHPALPCDDELRFAYEYWLQFGPVSPWAALAATVNHL